MNKLPILLEGRLVEVEIVEERVINEAKGDIELDVKVTWQHAGIININTRRYRTELLQREISRISEQIKKGDTVWGHPFHPIDGFGKSDEISHMWTKIWMKPDGVCEGTLTLLPTTSGKNIQTLVKAGRLGLSSRGFGTVTEKEEKIGDKVTKFLDVNDDYKMTTPGDWVPCPSVQGAGNFTEQISILESELNKGLDLITKNHTILSEEIMIKTIEELRKEYPELVKQIEDEKEVALKAEAEKTDTEKDTKITEFETQVSEKDTKIKELEDENKELKTWKEKSIDEIRRLISSAGDIDGVIPESEDNDPQNTASEGDVENEAELAKAKKSLKEAEDKNAELEKEKKTKEDADKAEADAAKLQTQLKEKLEATLAKDEYKAYAELIEEDVTDEDGKITIESVEAVDGVVKATFEKINKIRATNVKEKIIKSKEKGRIASPEGDRTEQQITDELVALYNQDKAAGWKSPDGKVTFEEWKKEFPTLVEGVT